MAAQSVPDGHHTVTPYLTVRDALKVIDFLKSAFGAEVTHEPLKRPDGKIMHAEVKIGDSRVMIAEESEMAKAAPSSLYLYVKDPSGNSWMIATHKEDVAPKDLAKRAEAFFKQRENKGT